MVPEKRQNLLFSATFPARVEKLADEFLLWPTRVDVTPEGTPVESVEQFVVRAPNVQTKINAIKHWLTDTHPIHGPCCLSERKRTQKGSPCPCRHHGRPSL